MTRTQFMQLFFSAFALGFIKMAQTTGVVTLNAQGSALCAMASAMRGLTIYNGGDASKWNTTAQCRPSSTIVPSWCGWSGVTCSNSTFLVTDISLSGQSLNGSIPTSIAALNASLRSFDISSNPLTHTLPSQLGALTALTFLSVASTGITGSIPSAFARLTNLVHLDVATTSMGGSIPSQIGLLTSLTSLNLADTGFATATSGDLSKLVNLQSLVMR